MFAAVIAADALIAKLTDGGAPSQVTSPAPKAELGSFKVTSDDLSVLASTESDTSRVALLKKYHSDLHGQAPGAIAVSGGRVNLIGEHVDYPDIQFNNGNPVAHLYSMGGAIQNNYLVAASLRTDGKVTIAHLQVGEVFTFNIADLDALENIAEDERTKHVSMSKRTMPAWTFHTLGAIREMTNRGVRSQGMNLVLTSNVPHGAGMSNSAANCVALGIAFNALYKTLDIGEPIELVTFARKSENGRFAGGCCGWLDQLLIVCSEEGVLTKIDYADNSVQHFPSELPSHMSFVAFNTNVPHVLAESDYGHRVLELKTCIAFLSSHLGRNVGSPNLRLETYNTLLRKADPSVGDVHIPASLLDLPICQGETVCELSQDEIDKLLESVDANFQVLSSIPAHKGISRRLSFSKCLRRMRHQKMSSLLVPLAGEAATKGDANLFGLLLDTEGMSLRMSGDFMITGDNGAQDALLDAAIGQGKARGLEVHGRMLGGGGGGNVLLFVDKSNADAYSSWADETCAVYKQWADSTYPGQGIEATVIEPDLAPGARLLM